VKKAQLARSRSRCEIGGARRREIEEVKAAYVLQPGPASLTEGVRQLHTILARVAKGEQAPGLAPLENMDCDTK